MKVKLKKGSVRVGTAAKGNVRYVTAPDSVDLPAKDAKRLIEQGKAEDPSARASAPAASQQESPEAGAESPNASGHGRDQENAGA